MVQCWLLEIGSLSGVDEFFGSSRMHCWGLGHCWVNPNAGNHTKQTRQIIILRYILPGYLFLVLFYFSPLTLLTFHLSIPGQPGKQKLQGKPVMTRRKANITGGSGSDALRQMDEEPSPRRSFLAMLILYLEGSHEYTSLVAARAPNERSRGGKRNCQICHFFRWTPKSRYSCLRAHIDIHVYVPCTNLHHTTPIMYDNVCTVILRLNI